MSTEHAIPVSLMTMEERVQLLQVLMDHLGLMSVVVKEDGVPAAVEVRPKTQPDLRPVTQAVAGLREARLQASLVLQQAREIYSRLDYNDHAHYWTPREQQDLLRQIALLRDNLSRLAERVRGIEP